MRTHLISLLLVGLASTPAWASSLPSATVAAPSLRPLPAAQPRGDGETETLYGEVHVNMNSDYAKVRVGDEDWDSVEYERNGRRALIKGIELDNLPVTITLTPADESLAPQTFDVARKDFKRKRIARVWLLVATKRVKFVKKAQTPEPTEPAKKPADKPTKKTTPGDAPDDL